MLTLKRKDSLPSLLIVALVFSSITFSTSEPLGLPTQQELSINLKAKAVVLGPEVTLGDIGKIVVADSSIRSKLSSVRIGEAPPPGESSEIRLSHVKKCLKKAGFEKFLSILKGPKIVRITTAQVEIDKAFLKKHYATRFENDKTLKKHNIKLVSFIYITYNIRHSAYDLS